MGQHKSLTCRVPHEERYPSNCSHASLRYKCRTSDDTCTSSCCSPPKTDTCSRVAYPTVHNNVWTYINNTIDTITPNRSIQVGHTLHDGRWVTTSSISKFPELLSAIKFFAEHHLHLAHVVSARVGLGLRELPPHQGLHHCHSIALASRINV